MKRKKKVRLKPFYHKGVDCIGVYFESDLEVRRRLKKTGVVKYSATHRCWYFRSCREHYELVVNALSSLVDFDAGVTYPEGENKGQEQNSPGKNNSEQQPAAVLLNDKNGRIHPVNAHVLPRMLEYLKLKGYSPSTIRTYLQEMTHLIVLLKSFCADNLGPDHLKRYLVYCHNTLLLKENTLHSRINALKFYYEKVLGREAFFWDIPRPKKQLILPKVLGEDEVAKLFNSLTNLKHKAMMFTAYSAGLRVSEIAALQIRHIDSSRMQILVENAKGKKDRYVNLSPVLLDVLRSYIRTYTPRPRVFLFESDQTGKAYPVRTIQRIFCLAREKARISKNVGIHSLRHSFATHMLEKGVDIRYIKELLGHFSIKTTERYLHVTREKLINIISPFDDLWRTGKIDW